MAAPMEQRKQYLRLAVIGGVLLAVFLFDLATARTHAAVWTFVIGLLVSGLWLGVSQAGGVEPGAIASRDFRRRTSRVLAVGLVGAAAVVLSRAFDVERTVLQDVLAVVGVGVTAFLFTFSIAMVRKIAAIRPD